MMRNRESEVLVGRRYLSQGFIDEAMRLFSRNVSRVSAGDWTRLAGELMARGRIGEVVRVCTMGGVPLPREQLLARGDEHLRRKDVDDAIYFYELAGADRARWSRMVDVLTSLPERELRAIDIAKRYLVEEDEDDGVFPLPLLAAAE
jgi:hypothetical protein